ncbi:hypothetical protein [Phenylobacterium sp.]|uniref:hypothetical protein n=1 Tax=Phenylobacterium sp. TaxID=1871053 RepID=UPI0025D818AA|nr:hypothetical protein [Phenylobacterium sp.]
MLITLALAAPAAAPARFETGEVMLKDLAECGKLADGAAELDCYRRAAGALVRAEATGAIIVVDREEAREVRRQSFGLSLPSLALFDKGSPDAELDSVVDQVRAARQDGTGRWVLQLNSSGTWIQVETVPLRTRPTTGSTVAINRAALGSYKMRIGDQNAVRVRRIE